MQFVAVVVCVWVYVCLCVCVSLLSVRRTSFDYFGQHCEKSTHEKKNSPFNYGNRNRIFLCAHESFLYIICSFIVFYICPNDFSLQLHICTLFPLLVFSSVNLHHNWFCLLAWPNNTRPCAQTHDRKKAAHSAAIIVSIYHRETIDHRA